MKPGITLEVGTIVVLDGTLVYVEDVQRTYAAVVCLPDQDAKPKVFTPGLVRAKKISPFSTAERVVPVPELSDLNKEFVGTFERLRVDHGPNYVLRRPGVTAQDEASVEEPDVTVRKVEPKKARPSAASDARYTLTSTDLTVARSQPRGDRYNEGNRSYRVVAALRDLPEASGTVSDLVRAVALDGGKPLSDPEKVVRRTLAQLMTPEFGAIVTRS